MRQLIFDVAIREYVNKHPRTDGTRPAHPALISLDNAREHHEDDEGGDSAQASRTLGANGKGKRKTRASNKKQTKRTRQLFSSDSDADFVSSQQLFDEDSDEYEGESGEEVRGIVWGRQTDTQPAPKRRRKVTSNVPGDEDGGS
jgi:hypothetical protein